MSILNWFKLAFISAFAALVIALKVLLSRNKKLSDELEVKDKQIEIKVKQQKVKDEVHENEDKLIEDAKGSPGDSRADRLNGLLNDTNT